MTFRVLLVIQAAVCLVLGIYLLLAPASLLSLLGGSLSGAGVFTGREYGAAMIGTIGVVITVGVVVAGVLNALGWGIMLVYVFFTAGSGYLLAKERPFQARRAA